ncbi:MAG: replication protein RepA [Saprospiraceae bacterium]|jgi:disulfide oxidoreductase YuzD|nr:replication protein RepA [Saprospiraceae bacterium]
MTKENTPIQRRMNESHIKVIMEKGTIDDALFQHSVLCQTFLPYRNPGKDTRIWKHQQGRVNLAIQGREIYNPEKGDYEYPGLPYGAKARLILAHINSQAIKQQSPVVQIEDSMSAFMKKIGLNVTGRTIREIKDQLRRVYASTFSLAYQNENNSIQVDLQLADAIKQDNSFNLWFPKDESQRVLWKSEIHLGESYFKSLISHAIPLDERALASLSHNALALDIYAWLAQRLHRVNPQKPQFITWVAIKDQFGRGYSQMYKFKQKFRQTLKIALLQYPKARIREEKNKGFWLSHSPSPIEKKSRVFIGG